MHYKHKQAALQAQQAALQTDKNKLEQKQKIVNDVNKVLKKKEQELNAQKEDAVREQAALLDKLRKKIRQLEDDSK